MRPLDVVGWSAAGVYGLCMALLFVYALHGLWLLGRFARSRKHARATEAAEAATLLPADADLPHVLVQLPTFNERDVLDRVVAAAGDLDWPRDRLHIQVLDDSTDDSVELARAAVERLRERGVDAVLLHRVDRIGFKAGALDAGLAHDAGRGDRPASSFVAIFDADFVPKADFLRRAIRPFLADPGLALVQGRWEHHNREDNLLTRVQAIGIDGHFAIEQGARAWTGLAMNFNGTCGLWRRSAILDAGGWEHDTLTEDLDLSYRAQLQGWRCTYRLGLDVPGELPTTITAWRSQQFRWAKGSQQTARKLAGRLLGSGWSWHHKIAALLHLTHYAVHPLMLLSLIAAPIAIWLCPQLPTTVLMFGLIAFLVGVVSPLCTYAVSQFTLHGRRAWGLLRLLPALASIGTGIAISNSRAVYEAWTGVVSPFVRTPKQGSGSGSYRSSATTGIPELLCAAWALLGMAMSVQAGRGWIAPLLTIYASGFAWVGVLQLRTWLAERRSRWREASALHRRSRPSTLLALGLLGSAALACYVLLGSSLPDTWHSRPVRFAALGLGAGVCYLLASLLVLRRPGGRWVLALILVFGLLFRIAGWGIAASDDLNRYVVEGRQWAYGQNPYAVAPVHPPAQELLRPVLDPAILDAVNHEDMTAIYPPVMIWCETVVSHIDSRVLTMKLVMGLCEVLAMVLVLAMLARSGLPAAWILLALWNPVGPIWFSGEGHNDSLMVLLLCGGLWAMQRGRQRSGSIALSLAVLAKPFAAWVFLPFLLQQGWRALLIPVSVAILAYLPFLGAGAGLFASIGTFGHEMHFHGALEPLYRLLADTLTTAVSGTAPDPDRLRLVVTAALVVTLLLGSWLVLRRDRAEGREADGAGLPGMMTTGRLVAVLLLCLPTCYPWYMLLLVVCLPFMGSTPGVLLWTAMTPLYWLHGVAMQENGGEWIEWPLITVLAHSPAVLLLGWDALGRPGLGQRISGDALPATESA